MTLNLVTTRHVLSVLGRGPPGHGAELEICRGGVSDRVAPAPQQGVTRGQQAGQRRSTQGMYVPVGTAHTKKTIPLVSITLA